MKIPFKEPPKDSTVTLKYEVFKGPKGDLIIDGDKITFVKHDQEAEAKEAEEEQRKAEEKQRRKEASRQTTELIAEIQDHYRGMIETPTTAELAKHLKEAGDDLSIMSEAALERRVNLWGFFQKTEGDLDDYFREGDGLPEKSLKNELFYNQWKGKGMLEIIINFHDEEGQYSGDTFTPLSFVLNEYGAYLNAKAKQGHKVIEKID